jgi:hypothetical protein
LESNDGGVPKSGNLETVDGGVGVPVAGIAEPDKLGDGGVRSTNGLDAT